MIQLEKDGYFQNGMPAWMCIKAQDFPKALELPVILEKINLTFTTFNQHTSQSLTACYKSSEYQNDPWIIQKESPKLNAIAYNF